MTNNKFSGVSIVAGFALIGTILWGTFMGVVMCFQANVLLGFASLPLQGSGFLEWVVFKVGGYDIALHVARAVGLH